MSSFIGTPAPELPRRQQSQSITKPKFELIQGKLEEVRWSKLKQKAAKESMSASGILLTAFAEILKLWSRKPQFTMNLTYLARLPFHPQVNKILGDFTSIILLGIENDSRLTFLGKAKQVLTINSSASEPLKYTLIRDPQQRKEFKAKQLGLRQDVQLLSLGLSKPNQKQLELEYRQRATVRQFSPETITLANFSQFLGCLSQIELDNQPRYLYPSAGGLYPIQVYLHLKANRIEGLAEIINNPQQKICQLPLLTETEKKQILIDWTNLKADYPNDKCIHQLFEEQVVKKPTAFVFLDEFPLTPNGKIDKKALPLPDFEKNRENEFIAPRNEIEVKLAQIWQEVLGRENISINDNFFEIGGHSLLAIQLISRIQENFQLELSLYYVFEAPTIKKLSDTIDILLWGKSGLVTANSSDYLTGEI